MRLGRSLLVVSVSMLATACGRKGPLLYPDMLVPAAPAAVTAQQSGSAVKLQFTLPDKDQTGRPLQGVAGVKISRRSAEADQKEVCRSCMTDYLPFQTVYLERLPVTTQRFGNRLVVIDSDVSPGRVYSYSIKPYTADGVDGASSTAADVRVVTPLPAPVLKAESLPTEIRIQLFSPLLPIGRFIGYNLYRSSGTESRSLLPLNREPMKGSEYVDGALERGVTYRYSARAVMVLVSGDVVESAESVDVERMLKDDE